MDFDYSKLTLKQKKDLHRTYGHQIHLMITDEQAWRNRMGEQEYMKRLKKIVKRRILLKKLIEEDENN